MVRYAEKQRASFEHRVRFPQEKVPMLCLQNISIRKKGIEQSSKSIARRAGPWLLGPSQKLGMVKHTPHGPLRKYTLFIKKEIATLKLLILIKHQI